MASSFSDQQLPHAPLSPSAKQQRIHSDRKQRCSRRDLLKSATLSSCGLLLPGLLTQRTDAGVQSATRAKSCILIFLNGGPSHLDMWDLKPDGPVDIRGEFRPIQTTVSGIQLSEHLPRLAQQMHQATLIRSMHHSVNNSHAAAVYAAMTGHDRGEFGGGAKPDDYPPPGAVLSMLKPSERSPISYVSLPFKTQEGAGGPLQPGFQAGFIGRQYDPFWVLNDPNDSKFQIPNLGLVDGIQPERMDARQQLFSQISSQQSASRFHDAEARSLDSFHLQAFDVLTSTQVRAAFDVGAEPDSTRESYGRNIYGQSVLLARRLVEAGTRLVTISWAPDANATWDTHGNNFASLKNTLLPQFDAACSSLLADLDQRGLLDETLVAVLGDFGRSPKINGNAGRDHWNACYTVMLAGAGVRRGFVFGASDRSGATPIRNPVAPGDILATIYHLFGVDPHQMIYDQLGRPIPLIKSGELVRDILA
jgi:uncharacterized protein (DUF1501 family)